MFEWWRRPLARRKLVQNVLRISRDRVNLSHVANIVYLLGIVAWWRGALISRRGQLSSTHVLFRGRRAYGACTRLATFALRAADVAQKIPVRLLIWLCVDSCTTKFPAFI